MENDTSSENDSENDSPAKKPRKLNNQPVCSNLSSRRHSAFDVITLRRQGRMNRVYRIHTPPQYNSNRPHKVALAFHGWGETSLSYTDPDWLQAADDNNYILVMPEGIQQSWRFPGSADGVGRDGESITICDFRSNGPDYCYDGCACRTRCGWTQCVDDDVQFVADLLDDLSRHICVDTTRIYSTGISNGAMLTWTLGQDARTAPRLAGLAPMIGTPHPDYAVGKATSGRLPVIGIYGKRDDVVPPGGYQESQVEDTAGYYWIPPHRLHSRWAADHGCPVRSANGRAPISYGTGSTNLQGFTVSCRSHCPNGENQVPYSVDCRADMGHETPVWMMHVALRFFEQHFIQQQRQQQRNRNGNLFD
ncbi:Esterase PHB depolymerase [Seminavis robusta]|uniref:Esterase PHB depolymerase n=1 Tax=Seminavis robusta TaxID=568900 RepID=A0A9N8HAG1_9STRA|nr:Esterase PHB depolymerase [Seminavis robusta]|eukprot:Sro240_g096200.1 Esterase PHB depolymerase (363) ;mRNA; r:82019-83107